MKILLLSVSARGHAIAEALQRSSHAPEIISICPVANPGLKEIASALFVLPLSDLSGMVEIAKKVRPDFAVIGPEAPIAAGIVDLLAEHGVPSVGPNEELARIESSKGFTRDLLTRHGIEANPKYHVFHAQIRNPYLAGMQVKSEIRRYIEEDLQGEYVVKFDALAGGKGVKVSGEHLRTVEEGVMYAEECIEKAGQVVVEEKLVGPEFSLMSFVSGKTVVSMPAVQDHKRAYEGDEGPNTGGMGSYSDANHSLPFLNEVDLEQAHEFNVRTAEALLKETKEPYKGILYGGFIVCSSQCHPEPRPPRHPERGRRVRLIEYNCRFGDPEVLNVLPLLETDFVDICRGIVSGELTDNMVKFQRKATVCKYIVPKSYPVSKDQRGEPVIFPDPDPNPDPKLRLYFGDICGDDGGTLRLGGSRSAGVVGIGETIEEAEKIAEEYCKQIKGLVRHRRDIGTRALIEKRMLMLDGKR
jgi:phosphoribosylamine--glycine ligase